MPNRTVVLSCLHTVIMDPVPEHKDLVFCARCDDWKAYIAPSQLSKYEVVCFDCRRVKPTKLGLIGAETKAIRHSLTARGHRVGIWQDNSLDQVFYKPRTETLDGRPPF